MLTHAHTHTPYIQWAPRTLQGTSQHLSLSHRSSAQSRHAHSAWDVWSVCWLLNRSKRTASVAAHRPIHTWVTFSCKFLKSDAHMQALHVKLPQLLHTVRSIRESPFHANFSARCTWICKLLCTLNRLSFCTPSCPYVSRSYMQISLSCSTHIYIYTNTHIMVLTHMYTHMHRTPESPEPPTAEQLKKIAFVHNYIHTYIHTQQHITPESSEPPTPEQLEKIAFIHNYIHTNIHTNNIRIVGASYSGTAREGSIRRRRGDHGRHAKNASRWSK